MNVDGVVETGTTRNRLRRVPLVRRATVESSSAPTTSATVSIYTAGTEFKLLHKYINQSINRLKHIYTAPYVASESDSYNLLLLSSDIRKATIHKVIV